MKAFSKKAVVLVALFAIIATLSAQGETVPSWARGTWQGTYDGETLQVEIDSSEFRMRRVFSTGLGEWSKSLRLKGQFDVNDGSQQQSSSALPMHRLLNQSSGNTATRVLEFAVYESNRWGENFFVKRGTSSDTIQVTANMREGFGTLRKMRN